MQGFKQWLLRTEAAHDPKAGTIDGIRPSDPVPDLVHTDIRSGQSSTARPATSSRVDVYEPDLGIAIQQLQYAMQKIVMGDADDEDVREFIVHAWRDFPSLVPQLKQLNAAWAKYKSLYLEMIGHVPTAAQTRQETFSMPWPFRRGLSRPPGREDMPLYWKTQANSYPAVNEKVENISQVFELYRIPQWKQLHEAFENFIVLWRPLYQTIIQHYQRWAAETKTPDMD